MNKNNKKIIMVNKNESKNVNIIEVKKIFELDSFFFSDIYSCDLTYI